MPRRNLIPVALLAVLALLTLLFAVFGASAAPSGATLAVQNASGETFGSPTGSTSFTMDLVNTVSSGGTRTGTVTLERLIDYLPPDRMAVYQVGAQTKLLGVLDPAATTCALSGYTAIVGGSTPWTASGTSYTRAESLADYSSRVPQATATSCAPSPASVEGQVHESAVVRSGYLVGVRLTVVVPPQTLSNGRPAAQGVENQTLVFVEINGTRTRSLGR